MAVTCRFPQWRIVSTDLDSNVATILDRVASNRHVHPLLNVPNWQAFDVPSSSQLVNTPYPDPTDQSYVAEGDRLLYWFRQESDTPPYWVCRAAGISLQVEDAAAQDEANTTVTSFDPWKLAYCRPAQASDGELPVPMGNWDGVYPAGSVTTGEIVLTQLLYTITNNGTMRIDAGEDWGGTAFYAGTLESTVAISADYIVTPGLSVGDVWTAMVNTATLDIVLTPIFDPINRPGYTHEMSIYVQAGVFQPNLIYSWDLPPHNIVQVSRMKDGTQRANKMIVGAGQGGSAGVSGVSTDAGSVTQYGEYWGMQFVPSVLNVQAVQAMADFQLSLRAQGRETVQITPAPRRSPCPFVDFTLGDRGSLYASRQAFRQELNGEFRVYGFPLDIQDDGTEEVSGMVLLPQA